MNTEKKSFLLYLDNWEAMKVIPVEQRGWVLTAVYEYALELGCSGTQEIWTFLERYPDMDAAARVACAFMCTTIARDTRKWLCQKASRRKKALEGQHTRAQEDMEQAKRLLMQMQ